MRIWWNRQTRYFEVVVGLSRGGSSPLVRTILFGVVAQLGERLPCKEEVRGSIPLNSTILYSPIAQSVEHRTVNPSVTGSSPVGRAIWRIGQAVKTPPFHGGNMGSIPVCVTKC